MGTCYSRGSARTGEGSYSTCRGVLTPKPSLYFCKITTCSVHVMQGPMPSTDGAIGLGLGTICLLKVPGLSGPRLDAKTSERPCGAPLPSLRASLCAPQHASGAEALTPPSRMRNTANLLGWSDWIVGPPRRSRIDLSCHQTRAVSGLTQVSHALVWDSGRTEVGGG